MLRDPRCATRQLTRSPGFTVLAMLMVGLGIAATTTMLPLVALVATLVPAPRATRVAPIESIRSE